MQYDWFSKKRFAANFIYILCAMRFIEKYKHFQPLHVCFINQYHSESLVSCNIYIWVSYIVKYVLEYDYWKRRECFSSNM